MRKFKTAEKNRTNYIYYTAEDKKIVLTPEDVDSDWIAFLHGEDDESMDADRREDYHVPVHYDAYSDGDGDDAADRNAYMEDDAPDPFESLIQSMDEAEHEDNTQWYMPSTVKAITAVRIMQGRWALQRMVSVPR